MVADTDKQKSEALSELIDVVYTDLEKAFDKIPHRRLISRPVSRKI